MADKAHPKELRAAIDALAQADEKISAAEIWRRVMAGELTDQIAPYPDISKRTVQGYVQRARLDLEAINPSETKAINALERRMLQIVNRDVARLDRKARDKALDSKDSAALRSHHLTITQIRTERRRQKEQAERDPERVAAGMNGKRAREGAPESLLAKIAAEYEARGGG